MKKIASSILSHAFQYVLMNSCESTGPGEQGSGRTFNESYSGRALERIAFPLGGMGAGMICVEGNTCISNVSVRLAPDVYHQIRKIENGFILLPALVFGSV